MNYLSRLLCPWNFPRNNIGWVAILFLKGSSQPRNQTHISCVSYIAGDSLPLSHQESPHVCIYMCVTRTRPSFPHTPSLPSGSFHKSLILIHQGADRRSKNYNPMASKWKPQSQKTKMITWITGVTQWSYEPCQ